MTLQASSCCSAIGCGFAPLLFLEGGKGLILTPLANFMALMHDIWVEQGLSSPIVHSSIAQRCPVGKEASTREQRGREKCEKGSCTTIHPEAKEVEGL